MSDLEQELREALGRVEPPEGFAGRVVALAEAQTRRSAGRTAWLRAAAAVLIVAAALGGWFVQRERNERAEARETQEQFRIAMRVTARVTSRSFAEAGRRINRTAEERTTR